MVYLVGAGLLNVSRKMVIEVLVSENIPYNDTNNEVVTTQNCQFPVIIKLRKGLGNDTVPCKVYKVINIVNSLPVEIK